MRRARGFTLIELMVGVALGLLATVVIAQVFLQSEGNKRATTSGTDAQVTGASALFTLQRDIQGAGYGLTAWPDGLGCPLSGSYSGATVLNPASDILAPVVIGFGASASASDTITVMASGKPGYSVPIKVASDHAAIDTKFTVASNLGVAANDFMLAMPAAWTASSGCTLFVATATTPTTEIPHAAANGWNASTAIFPSAGYPSGSILVNLGPAPVRRRYAVSVNSSTTSVNAWSLQVQDTLNATNAAASTAAQEMFPQVVLLKALYGMASAANGPVTSYSTAAPSGTNWRLVQSIRLVLVARSGQFEKDAVTLNAPEWAVGTLLAAKGNAGTTLGACRQDSTSTCLVLDVSASGAGNVTDPQGATQPEWQHYRYKVFDTIVPLRNVVWNQS